MKDADLEQAPTAMLRSQQLMKINQNFQTTEISNLKKENYQKVNILPKVHLQELDDLKQMNNFLTQNIDDFEKRLASQDIEKSNTQYI